MGLEIGCGDSRNSLELVQEWESTKFYCIPSEDITNATVQTIRDLASYKKRVILLQNFTQATMNSFKINSLDLVHIGTGFDDSVYDESTISSILELWWPKLKVGGLVVGGIPFVEGRILSASVKKRKLRAIREIEKFAINKKRQLVFQYQVGSWAL